MLLPSKGIEADQALVTVGAQVLMQLDQPRTVSTLWESVLRWRSKREISTYLPFWWFALALDLLYLAGAVEFVGDEIRRTARAA